MNYIAKKHYLFSRGSFQIATFLLLFSPLFTRSFQQDVGPYVLLSSIMFLFNATTEYILIKKISIVPQKYIPFFLIICLPINILLLCFFYYGT
ncbi:hypothetical protein COK03_03835 [Priestia megaterium]|nr:hypothetical protein COK03_03835 [Priestia megaterium]